MSPQWCFVLEHKRAAPVASAVSMGAGREALPAEARPSSAIASALSTSAACTHTHPILLDASPEPRCPATQRLVPSALFVSAGVHGATIYIGLQHTWHSCRRPLLAVKQ